MQRPTKAAKGRWATILVILAAPCAGGGRNAVARDAEAAAVPRSPSGEAVSATASSVERLPAAQVRADFERMAAELPYLALNSVLYDRPRHLSEVADAEDEQSHRNVLRQIRDPSYSKEALLDLLKHDDPKVRTLALAALFSQEDPSVLPVFVAMADDAGKTFDGHPELSKVWLRHTGIGPPQREQTVGYIADKMVEFYMKRADFHYGIRHKNQPAFAEYWQARKTRPYCASWFDVQLSRASQGTYPTPPDRAAEIRAVRDRIDRLPADDRAWTLLWLHGEDGSDVLATEAELLEAAGGLGPDKLLQMLKQEIPSDDPDLHLGKTINWKYERMMLWVLQRARPLLRADQAPALLACERDLFSSLRTAWWAIAASELQPQHARQWLHEAFDRFQGKYEGNYRAEIADRLWRYDGKHRAELAAALWRLEGPTEISFLLDWFFHEPESDSAHPDPPSQFLLAIKGRPHAAQKRLIAAIIRDPRFSQLGFQPVDALAQIVNAWLPEPILDRATMLENRYSPQAPQYLTEWKAKLSASVPNWNDSGR